MGKSIRVLVFGSLLLACHCKSEGGAGSSRATLQGPLEKVARNEYPPLSAEEHARIKAKLAKSPDVHVLDLEAVAGPTSFELRDGRILRLAFLTPPTDPKTVRAAERRLRQIFLDTRGVVYTTSKQLFEKSEGKVTAQANVVLDGLVLVDAASALVQEGLARARSEGDTPSPIMYQRDP